MEEEPITLVGAISAALIRYDPLDPWLVVTNFDETHWDDVAKSAAPLVANASSPADIYGVLAIQMKPFIRPPEQDQYVRERLAAAAEAVWQWMHR